MSGATYADSKPELAIPLVGRLQILRAINNLASDTGGYE